MKEQKIEKSNFNCQKQLFAEKLKLEESSEPWASTEWKELLELFAQILSFFVRI